jgi:hypothetical protein
MARRLQDGSPPGTRRSFGARAGGEASREALPDRGSLDRGEAAPCRGAPCRGARPRGPMGAPPGGAAATARRARLARHPVARDGAAASRLRIRRRGSGSGVRWFDPRSSRTVARRSECPSRSFSGLIPRAWRWPGRAPGSRPHPATGRSTLARRGRRGHVHRIRLFETLTAHEAGCVRPGRPARCAQEAAIRAGLQGGSKVRVTSTRSTPGTRSAARRTQSAITAWRGQPGAVSVIVIRTAAPSITIP